MTVSEFSNEFDILYNNASNMAPGLDEYEKSVFLTKAQIDLVKAYFNPKTNKPQDGYDDSEIRQSDFSAITVTKIFENSDISDAKFDYRENSKSFELPSDMLTIINEYVEVKRGVKKEDEDEDKDDRQVVRLNVVPITYGEYSRLMSKPYKRPYSFQAWRIFSDGNSDLVVGPKDEIINYGLRYVKIPRPIILEDLGTDTIGGQSEAQTSELGESIHHEILQRAVELAKSAYLGDLTTDLLLGSQSQTDMGIVTNNRDKS